jgi:uncharacterized membrane protein
MVTTQPQSSQPPVQAPPTHHGTPAEAMIQDAAGWILRIGSIASVAIMVAGLICSMCQGTLTVRMMRHARFDYRPTVIWSGLCAGQGQAIIELGIYLLVFTPILRVFTSMVIFAVVERDWRYALITLIVLALTLGGLLLVG